MTAQQYYDLLCVSAFDGTFPCVGWSDGGDMICRYRGDNGAKCAVGVLIPDERYEPRFEGNTVSTGGVLAAVDPVDGFGVREFAQVQTVHDNTSPIGVGRRAWNPGVFIDEINRLPCFARVQKLAGNAGMTAAGHG